MADDDVQLTDLEVIQRWSLAVRSASADRAEVVAALRADLAWLEGRGSAARSRSDDDGAPSSRPSRRTASTGHTSTRAASGAKKTPAKKTSATKTPATKTPAKKAATRSSASRAGGRR